MNTLQVKTGWASYFDERFNRLHWIPKIQQDYPVIRNGCKQIGNEYPDTEEFRNDEVLGKNNAVFSDTIIVEIICDDETLAKIQADSNYIISG